MASQWHFPHPARLAFDPADAWFAVRSTTGALAVAEVATGDPPLAEGGSHVVTGTFRPDATPKADC